MEQLEKEKYNPNDIFKNRKQNILQEEIESDSVAMVECKESIFKRLLNKIKNIYKKLNQKLEKYRGN